MKIKLTFMSTVLHKSHIQIVDTTMDKTTLTVVKRSPPTSFFFVPKWNFSGLTNWRAVLVGTSF